jgi:glyoxylase-like metal-dependent hydrolase (beta-lactamase superfamily II)
MSILSRRTLLAGAASAAALPCFDLWSANFAHAATPAAGKQAASFYRYKVGAIEVTVLSDGVARVPVTEAFVLNVKPEEVNKALREAYMEPGVFIGPYNPIVLNTGSKLALVDMGTGEAAYIASKGVSGQLLANMAAAGIDPNAIDTIILSHYHGDHINGLLKADNTLAFPNAEVLAPAKEHQYWTDAGEETRAATPRIADLFKNTRRVIGHAEVMKRLRTYEYDKEVIPGVLAVATPGHTPGHTSHIVTSGSSSVYVQADVTHAPFLFARHPGWHAFYDHDPVAAEATRRKVYDMLSAEKMTVQGFHYPFPSVAHVEKTADGYREIPVAWSPVL